MAMFRLVGIYLSDTRKWYECDVEITTGKMGKQSGSLFFHQVGQIWVLGALVNTIGMLMARSLNLEGFQGLVFKKKLKKSKSVRFFLTF